MSDIIKTPDGVVTTNVPAGSIVWRDVRQHRPVDRKVYLVTGPSGYITDGMTRFVALARINEDYRPSRGGPLRWIDEGGDAITDRGWEVHFFADPILLPVR